MPKPIIGVLCICACLCHLGAAVAQTTATTVDEKDAQSSPLPKVEQLKRSITRNVYAILDNPKAPSIFDERENQEQRLLDNPFALSQYRQNYLLPLTYATSPNDLALDTTNTQTVDNYEAKYQISLKMPVWVAEGKKSGLFFGFSLVSFWQVYNDELSKPFRETNYEPEIFYQWQTDLSALDMRFNSIAISLNHQSNGASGALSRSWNRIILSTFFSSQNAAYYLRAWYRLPEDDKVDINDPFGDDNPDILDFIGRAELGFAVRLGQDFKLLTKIRNNLKLSENRGSIEMNLTYPVGDRYDVMIQYFNGYGDSLIDYNRHQQRVGLGVQLRFL